MFEGTLAASLEVKQIYYRLNPEKSTCNGYIYFQELAQVFRAWNLKVHIINFLDYQPT